MTQINPKCVQFQNTLKALSECDFDTDVSKLSQQECNARNDLLDLICAIADDHGDDVEEAAK